MRRVSGERHNGLNAQMMTSGFVSLLMSLFCVAFMFRQSLSKGGTGGPRLTWSLQFMIPKAQKGRLFSHTSKEGIPTAPSPSQSLLLWGQGCSTPLAKTCWYVLPHSPRGVPAWRSPGGQVCLEPHKVDFHWKEGSTQKGLCKEKYSSYPPVCPSSQT